MEETKIRKTLEFEEKQNGIFVLCFVRKQFSIPYYRLLIIKEALLKPDGKPSTWCPPGEPLELDKMQSVVIHSGETYSELKAIFGKSPEFEKFEKN